MRGSVLDLLLGSLSDFFSESSLSSPSAPHESLSPSWLSCLSSSRPSWPKRTRTSCWTWDRRTRHRAMSSARRTPRSWAACCPTPAHPPSGRPQDNQLLPLALLLLLLLRRPTHCHCRPPCLPAEVGMAAARKAMAAWAILARSVLSPRGWAAWARPGCRTWPSAQRGEALGGLRNHRHCLRIRDPGKGVDHERRAAFAAIEHGCVARCYERRANKEKSRSGLQHKTKPEQHCRGWSMLQCEQSCLYLSVIV